MVVTRHVDDNGNIWGIVEDRCLWCVIQESHAHALSSYTGEPLSIVVPTAMLLGVLPS